MEKKHDGIYLVGQYSFVKCGAWLLVDNDECALFEAPEYDPDETPPVDTIKRIIEENNLKLKYVLISHPHRDHIGSVNEYKKAFPEASFIAHKTASYILNGSCSGQLLVNPGIWKSVPDSDDIFDHLFEDSISLPLGSKTIHQIYAPKHSPGDVLTYFNEVLFTGDWWVLEGDPGSCREVLEEANDSINHVFEYIEKENLNVRHIFPSHANNMMFDVNLREALYRSLVPPGAEMGAAKCPMGVS